MNCVSGKKVRTLPNEKTNLVALFLNHDINKKEIRKPFGFECVLASSSAMRFEYEYTSCAGPYAEVYELPGIPRPGVLFWD